MKTLSVFGFYFALLLAAPLKGAPPFPFSSDFFVDASPESRAALWDLHQRAKETGTASDLETRTLDALVKQIPGAGLGTSFERNTRALLDWHGLVPCLPSQIKVPVTFILSAELHRGSEWAERKKAYFNLARANRVLLGAEANVLVDPSGVPYPPHENVSPSLDTWQLHAMTDLGNQLLAYHTGQKNALGLQMFRGFYHYAFLRTAWSEVPRPFEDPEVERVARRFDALLDLTDNDRARASNQYEDVDSKTDPLPEAPLAVAAEALVLRLKQTWDSPQERLRHLTPKLENFQSGFFRSKENQLQFRKKIVRDWRDKLLTTGGSDLICETVQKLISIVVVQMGMAHGSGVYADLKETLRRSELEDRVKVLVDVRSKNSPELAKILKVLPAQGSGVRDFMTLMETLPPEERLTDERYERLFGPW